MTFADNESSACELYTQKNSPSKECVIRESGDQDAICELNYSREHDEDKEGVDDFQSRWCLVVVAIPRAMPRNSQNSDV